MSIAEIERFAADLKSRTGGPRRATRPPASTMDRQADRALDAGRSGAI